VTGTAVDVPFTGAGGAAFGAALSGCACAHPTDAEATRERKASELMRAVIATKDLFVFKDKAVLEASR
jgi:hypothetical protein